MRKRFWMHAALAAGLAAHAPAAPWDVLPWFGDDHRDPDTPIEMRIRLKVGGRDYPVDATRDGLDQAREVLARVFPGRARDGSVRAESSQVYQLLEAVLDDDTNHTEALRIAGLSRKHHFGVELVLDDHAEPLTPGAVLSVPRRCRFLFVGCRSTYTVKEGDTLEGVAEEYGLTEEELRKRNKRALEVHPHARNQGGIKTVHMGEAGLGKRSDDFGTFLHELGHVGDETRCSNGYGPDGGHRMSEILTPASAFKEGWAQYQAAHHAGRRQRILADPPELTLEREPVPEGEDAYVEVELADRTLNDYLANEARVGSVLTALEALPPGREAVEQAFLATREDCRSVVTLLAAYVEANPDHAEAAEAALREWTDDVGSDREVQQALAGILPRCLGPKELPRSREYEPGSARRRGNAANAGRAASTPAPSSFLGGGGASTPPPSTGGSAPGGLFGLAGQAAERVAPVVVPVAGPIAGLLADDGCDG